MTTPPTYESARHELVQLAFSYGGSTRLRNSLLFAQQKGLLEPLTIRHVLDDDAEVSFAFQRVPGFGAKCLAELKQLAARAVEAKASCTAPLISSETRRPELDRPDCLSTPFPSELPAKKATDVLGDLNDRAQEILRLRLGLDGKEPRTLAAIGAAMGVTRERIRQIEAKSLERLKQCYIQTFSQMLLNSQAVILARLAVHQVIHDQDETQLFLALDHDSRLLVAVTYGSAHAWLDVACRRVQDGWLLPSISIEAYQLAQSWIRDQLSKVHLPCSIAAIRIPDAPPEEAVQAVLRLAKGLTLHGGYLLPARSTRRARRAVRSHALMLGRCHKSLSVSELRDAYLRTYQDDQCSARDLLIVLSDNPQLFLNQYEMGWFAIGTLSADAGSTQPNVLMDEGPIDAPADGEEEPSEPETESLRGFIAQVLLEHGPQTFNDLRRRVVRLVGSRYSKASVGPILISNDEFVRIGPGLYAHRRHLQDDAILESSVDLLLNKAQIETFCRAMWAGESPASYVLWTRNMEVRWAEWALQSGQERLLSSLLAICEIESWPIKGGDRMRWGRLRDRMSVYLLEETPQPLTDRLPSLREFLSAAVFAANAGRVSWMSINRATGRRVDDRHSISCLALMIAGGIVEPAMHWQQEHIATDRALRVLEPILHNAERDALAIWPKAVVRLFRQNYESLLEPGWTADALMESLFDALSQSSLGDDLPESGIAPELDEYQTLKGQLRDDLALDRLRKRFELRNPSFR